MAQEILLYLSLIISVAAILTIVARVIRQPPIIAYLLSGIFVGPLFMNFIGAGSANADLLQNFARIGVAFLLFIVGLSLDFRLLREIGKVSAIAGAIQMALVGLVGFFVSLAMGFSNIASIYIGSALAFSSTVVVVKILSDKREMNTLHGRISLGILIVQDIVASVALMLIPLINSEGKFYPILQMLGLAVLAIAFVFLISYLLFSSFLNYLAKSQEALFIFGIAWALIIATIFFNLGFSIEIGALIAGMSLASSKYALDLEGKMKPLRDFFIILFFVFFGSQLTGPITYHIIRNALIFSVIVILIKPLVVMVTMKFFGYTKKTNLLTSLSLSQISEFSLILLLLGFSLGQVNAEIMNLAVLVALITIGINTYVLNFSENVSSKLLKYLDIFDGKISEGKSKEKSYDIILFGYHRIGYKLLETIRKTHKNFLIVDYNPKVVVSLCNQGIDAVYGDAGNKHFLKDIPLDKAKIVVSTIPDQQSNMAILEAIQEQDSSAVFIATSEDPRTALGLYDAGADYVIIPHHLGGEYAANLIKDFGTDHKKYLSLGKAHKISLQSGKKKSTYVE